MSKLIWFDQERFLLQNSMQNNFHKGLAFILSIIKQCISSSSILQNSQSTAINSSKDHKKDVNVKIKRVSLCEMQTISKWKRSDKKVTITVNVTSSLYKPDNSSLYCQDINMAQGSPAATSWTDHKPSSICFSLYFLDVK